MPTETASTSLAGALDTENPLGHLEVQPNQPSELHQFEDQSKLLISSHLAAIPVRPQTVIDDGHYEASSKTQNGEDEDEHTICGYGDISLSEIIVPPLALNSPTRPSSNQLQPKISRPRLYLKVRRPPMPRRRMSYISIPDPLPHTGGSGLDERWPGSPRLVANSSPWLQHQPMVTPLPVESPQSAQALGGKPVKNGSPSLEKFIDKLLPRSPSIRLLPPGSPTCQAFSLPQKLCEQKNDILEGQGLLESIIAGRPVSQSIPKPAPQEKSKSPAWRTRLPPRLPIPKWDM